MSPKAAWLLVNEIVPRLKNAVPNAVNAVGCEDAEELIQDATVTAAKLLTSVERAGKTVTAGNITHYTIQLMRSGRRSTGSSCVDALQAGTQINGRSEMVSLDGPISDDSDDCLTLHDMLSTDNEDPATIATRNLDWNAFCQTLCRSKVAVLEGMAQGRTLRDMANERGVCDSTMQNHRRFLNAQIRQFMGENILKDLAETPAWKNGLMANRQRGARKAMARNPHRGAMAASTK